MSTVAIPPVKPGDQSTPSAPTAAPAAVEFQYTQTESFVALLQQLGASLVITTYQANKLLVARVAAAGLSMLVRTFDRPMGLAVDAHRLTIGTRKEVWFLRNALDIAAQVEPAGQHDACYLPRSSHVTGDIGVHELAWAAPHPQPLSPEGRSSCGWSTPGSRACARCTPTTASCRSGGRRSSPPWPRRTVAI